MDRYVSEAAQFTVSAALVEFVDRKVIIVLRDGRKIVGVLRSYDQFGNVVLLDAVERLHLGLQYADIPRGIYVVRGENMSMLGEIDLDIEDEPPIPLEQVEPEIIVDHVYEEEEKRKRSQKERDGALLTEAGFSPELQEVET